MEFSRFFFSKFLKQQKELWSAYILWIKSLWDYWSKQKTSSTIWATVVHFKWRRMMNENEHSKSNKIGNLSINLGIKILGRSESIAKLTSPHIQIRFLCCIALCYIVRITSHRQCCVAYTNVILTVLCL